MTKRSGCINLIALVVIFALMSTISVSIANAYTEKERVEVPFEDKYSIDYFEYLDKGTGFGTFSYGLMSSADDYETDDYIHQANYIVNTGVKQSHTFDTAGESDWVKFYAQANTTYIIETANTSTDTDTHIILYDTDKADTLAVNDDISYPTNNMSQIIYFFKESGLYYLKIRDLFSKGGSYSLSVENTTYNVSEDGGDDYEFDNTYHYANWINNSGETQNHSFEYFSNDYDWLKFNATSGKTYIIWTNNTSTLTDTYLKLFDVDGQTELSKHNNINATNKMSMIKWLCNNNGTYYLRIYDLNNKKGNYTITLNETTYNYSVFGGDQYEANISDNNATYATNTSTNGTLYYHSFDYFTQDEDYRVFNVSANTLYVIEATNTSGLTDPYLELFESDGVTNVTYNDDLLVLYNSDSRIVFIPTSNTFYYTRTFDRYGKNGNYSFRIYNETPTTIYANGTLVNKTFNKAGGVEFVKFTAATGLNYTIETQNASDTYIYLYDENMTLLRENDDNYLTGEYTSKIHWHASSEYNGDTMYVMISDPYKYGGTVNVSLTNSSTAGDDYEQDGYLSLAQWIDNNGTPQNHSFYPVGEADWLKFNATSGKTYWIETVNTTTNTDTYIFLYFSNGTEITSNNDIFYESSSNNNRSSRIVWNATATGTYYIQLTDRYNKGGNYSVSVTEEGHLSIDLINPSSAKNVTQYGTFEFTVNVTCNSGFCGDVNIILDPEKQRISDPELVKENTELNEQIVTYKEIPSTPEFKTFSTENQRYVVYLKDDYIYQNKFGTLTQEQADVKDIQNFFLSSVSDEVKVERTSGLTNSIVMELSETKLNELKNNPQVEHIETLKVFAPMLDVSIPLVNADDVWTIQTGSGTNLTGEGQTVCIIDSGVNYSHPDLNGSYLGGYDTCNGSSGVSCGSGDDDPMDELGHGTHVAGIIVSNNTTYKGVAPGAKFVSVKVFNSAGYGDSSSIADGIEWCRNNSDTYNITVISMSLGTTSIAYNNVANCESDNIEFKNQIGNATEEGIIVVVSSGNTFGTVCNESYMTAPACIGTAISVGNTNDTDGVNTGSCGATFLDLFAPGTSIYSTALQGGNSGDCGAQATGYGSCSGTSMACPHVSGAILLLNQYYKSKLDVDLNKTQVRDYLNLTGVIINDTRTGQNFSRIDVLAALQDMESDFALSVIPMNSGTPFYTTSENPRYTPYSSCLQGMTEGDYCELTWTVNATGGLDYTWEFYVESESTLETFMTSNDSDDVNITIVNTDSEPVIWITSPINDASYNASDIWINATANSSTTGISYVQFRFENDTTNLTSWTNMTQTEHTENWYYLFNTENLTGENFKVNITASNSLGTTNYTYVNISMDNILPTIAIVSTYPQNIQTPWLNYTITDGNKNSTWYNLNDAGNYIVATEGNASINTTLNLIYPGLQNITVYANDTFSNTNSTTFTFYEFFLMNMSNWTTNTNTSLAEVISLGVSNSTGDITNNQSVNITTTMNISFTTNNFDVNITNVPGQNVTWADSSYDMNITETNTNISLTFSSAGSNVSKLISVYNMTSLVSDNSLYNVTTTIDGNNTAYTGIYFCENNTINSISNCAELSTCVAYTGTNCYNYTATTTTVYTTSFSTIVIENDTSAPTVTINTPTNKSYTANNETYNFTLNITSSDDAISCNYSINHGSNATLTEQAGTNDFVAYYIFTNANYNITAYCTDGNNVNGTVRVFNVNDTTDPTITNPSESGVDENEATITVYTDEFVYGVLFYASDDDTITDVTEGQCQNWTNSSVDPDDYWDDDSGWDPSTSYNHDAIIFTRSQIRMSPNFSLSGLDAGTHYYYGVCLCDYYDNCGLDDNNDLSTDSESSNDPSTTDSTGPSGGTSSNTTKSTKITSYWTDPIYPNVATTWNIASSSIPISQIIFKVSELITEGLQLELTSLGTSESATGLIAAPNNVYDYFKIVSYPYGVTNSAEFTIKIPKSWFTTNNYDSSKLRVYRYDSYTQQWNSIYTAAVETDGSEYTYKAKSDGFSFFAITAPSAPPIVIPEAGETLASSGNQTTVTSETINITCGDGICSDDETCSICPEDCGDCDITILTFFSNAGSFFKMYWIPMTISLVIISGAVGFLVVMTKTEFSSKSISVGEKVKEGMFSILPKKKSKRKETPKQTASERKRTFELNVKTKTKQTMLELKKKELQQKQEEPKKKKSIFKVFNKGKKREDIEELKKEPGTFRLK